jgi:hypothetical protein
VFVIALLDALDDNQLTLLWRDSGIREELEKWSRERYSAHKKWHNWLGDPQTLLSTSDQELTKAFIEYYKTGAGRHRFVNIHRGRIIRNINKLRAMLTFLLDEKEELGKRIDEVLAGEYHIRGVGKALVSSLLLDFNPTRYVVWNDVVTNGLRGLGRYPKTERGETAGRTYKGILRETERIRRLAPKPFGNYLDVDLFYYVVAKMAVGKRALRNVQQIQPPSLRDTRPTIVHIEDAFPKRKARHVAQVHFTLLGEREIDTEWRRAQDIVLDWERRRLQRAGRPDLARRVRDVSSLANLGYDISSFAENGEAMQIEVKSTKARKLTGFNLTSSEWSAAKEFGRTYRICVVLQPQTRFPRISELPNFAQEVKRGKFKLDPSMYFVTRSDQTH